jgi:hypothetical protein
VWRCSERCPVGGAVAPQFGGGLMGRTKRVLSEAAGHALATADQGLPLDGTDQGLPLVIQNRTDLETVEKNRDRSQEYPYKYIL